jgi:thiol:disulfide interchange protein
MERTETPGAVNQRDIPRWLSWAVVLLVAARVATVIYQKNEPAADLVRWVPMAEAQKRATASDRLIMYDFSAAWCGPCRSMDEAVFREAGSANQINGMVIPVRVVDRQREEGRNPPGIEALQKRYGIRAFPTIVFAEADGRESARMEGFHGRAAFLEVMRGAARFPGPRGN